MAPFTQKELNSTYTNSLLLLKTLNTLLSEINQHAEHHDSYAISLNTALEAYIEAYQDSANTVTLDTINTLFDQTLTVGGYFYDGYHQKAKTLSPAQALSDTAQIFERLKSSINQKIKHFSNQQHHQGLRARIERIQQALETLENNLPQFMAFIERYTDASQREKQISDYIAQKNPSRRVAILYQERKIAALKEDLKQLKEQKNQGQQYPDKNLAQMLKLGEEFIESICEPGQPNTDATQALQALSETFQTVAYKNQINTYEQALKEAEKRLSNIPSPEENPRKMHDVTRNDRLPTLIDCALHLEHNLNCEKMANHAQMQTIAAYPAGDNNTHQPS